MPSSMKLWSVTYSHRSETDNIRRYHVAAEDDDMAADVGKESLENDESNWDNNPNNWACDSVSQIQTCMGCGGLRVVSAPMGHGKVADL